MSDDVEGGRAGLLNLSEVLADLGQELRRASEVDEPVLDWWGAVVELETVAERSADGRVRFWVVDAGVGGASRTTVKITVNISPHGGTPMAAGK